MNIYTPVPLLLHAKEAVGRAGQGNTGLRAFAMTEQGCLLPDHSRASAGGVEKEQSWRKGPGRRSRKTLQEPHRFLHDRKLA